MVALCGTEVLQGMCKSLHDLAVRGTGLVTHMVSVMFVCGSFRHNMQRIPKVSLQVLLQ